MNVYLGAFFCTLAGSLILICLIWLADWLTTIYRNHKRWLGHVSQIQRDLDEALAIKNRKSNVVRLRITNQGRPVKFEPDDAA